jgi:N-acetylglutamate synthase-like GNAT family acetyltransferase
MIRQFQPEDSTACCSLIQECLANDSSLSSGLREILRNSETPQSMEERARLFFTAVFESEGRILGIVGLELNEIRLLCVSPEHRRRGIGRTLVEYIKSLVPDLLFSDIFVYSSIQGSEFYSACGFKEKGRVIFDIGGEQLRTVFMTFPLC